MEELNYDVVIVGGGPSGATVGNLLSKRNISCCIIDKEKFPRNKLCAGVLTEKTMELLESMDLYQGLTNYYNNSTGGFQIYYKGELSVCFKTDTYFYFTDRIDFDNLLINNFLKNGGKLFEGTRVSNIDLESNELIISDNKKVKFKYLIGADGTNSIFSKYADRDYKCNGFAVEIDLPRDNLADNYAKLYLGDITGNYEWIFPKKDHITIGLGGLFNKSIDYKQELDRFINKNIPGNNPQNYQIKGHYLPYGDYIRKPVYDNKLLLVGDAAGLADPISGEGIYFALLSGKYAAESIIERLEGKSDNFDIYLNELGKIHKIIDDGVWFQKGLYNNLTQKVAFNLIKGHNNIAAFVYDNLMSRYNYSYKEILKIIFDYKVGKNKNINK